MNALEEQWFAIDQAPQALISDEEGALNSDFARYWADKHGLQLKLKPPGNIGASTVAEPLTIDNVQVYKYFVYFSNLRCHNINGMNT